MENLTPKQNEIIKSITEQFAKLNRVNVNTSNPLLAIANICDLERKNEVMDRNIIQAQNDAVREANKHLANLDANYLQWLIDEVGNGLSLEVTHHENFSTIKIKKGDWGMSPIYYKLKKDEIRYKYINSIESVGDPKITFNDIEYYDIDEIINSGDFSNMFSKLLNR